MPNANPRLNDEMQELRYFFVFMITYSFVVMIKLIQLSQR